MYGQYYCALIGLASPQISFLALIFTPSQAAHRYTPKMPHDTSSTLLNDILLILLTTKYRAIFAAKYARENDTRMHILHSSIRCFHMTRFSLYRRYRSRPRRYIAGQCAQSCRTPVSCTRSARRFLATRPSLPPPWIDMPPCCFDCRISRPAR